MSPSLLHRFLCLFLSLFIESCSISAFHKAGNQIGQRTEENNDTDDDIDDLGRGADFGLQARAAIQEAAEEKACKQASDGRTEGDECDRKTVESYIFKCGKRCHSVRRLACDIEGRAETAQSAGDHHGMNDTLIDIDTCKTRSMDILSDRAQLITLAGPVEQMADHKCRNDSHKESYIDIRSSKSFLEDGILSQEGLLRLQSVSRRGGSWYRCSH